MAKKVTALVIGGSEKTFDDVTLSDLISQFDLDNPSIKVNGQTQDANYELKDYDYVSFGTKVKGGQA